MEDKVSSLEQASKPSSNSIKLTFDETEKILAFVLLGYKTVEVNVPEKYLVFERW